MKFFIQTLVLLSITTTSWATEQDIEAIDQRTKPVGQVRIAGTAPAVTEEATTESEIVELQEGPGLSGKALYKSFCITCHSLGLANAPKTGDEAAWAKVLEKGMDEVIKIAKKGKNVMPPMGTCVDCTDQELKNAILYMSKKTD